MRKKWLIFLLLIISISLFAGDIYLHLLTTGQPVVSYDLGDKFTEDWYVNMEVGQTWWDATDIGIGQSSSGTGENWATANWYEDGEGSNKRVRRSLLDFQFTATGTWYFYGRAKAESGDAWHYANDGSWTNTGSFSPTEYFTVNALNNPAFSSVTKNSTYSSTDIDLSLSEDAEGHNVLIVRCEGSAVTWTPSQGTDYSDGEDLGTNHVVVKGSYDPSGSGTTLTDNFLTPGTTYYYKVFSENWQYYSSGVEAATTYATTDALPQPTSVSAIMLSDSKIKVEWTADAVYSNVMLVARKGSDLSADPTNSTAYNVSDALGDGSVIYIGSDGSYTYSGLDANSTYYFRLYTAEENSDYYSSTGASTTDSATTHDGLTYHAVEFSGSNTDFSSDENVSGNYYLTWDDTYMYTAEFNGIDLSAGDKFVIAIDKDPGTANGYSPVDWGGYNFATYNDGTHKLEYIFAMGASFTNLYESSDNFTVASDKSSYTKLTGTYAEVAIPWADLGGRPTSDWEIIMWFSNSSNDWMDSVWPSSNPTTGTFPLDVLGLHHFNSAGTGITPNASGGITPLPVTLSQFSAIYDGEVPILQWITASEINNAGWNVYRAVSDDPAGSIQVNPELIEGQGTVASVTSYQFIDLYSVDHDQTYYYWLESVDYNTGTNTYGPISLFIPQPDDENNNSPEPPVPYGLHQNYPNPFNPSTEISFTLEYNSRVSLSIYNLKGHKVRDLLIDQPVSKSQEYYQSWDGKDNDGLPCGSGIYFYQLNTTKETLNRKMILIK